MSIQIIVNNTIIDFPSSAQSPNWSPALIEFAQNTAEALDGIVGEYDISPQVMNILNDGAEHPVETASKSLAFSTAAVRAATVRYSIFRKDTTNTYTHAETGLLSLIYNPNGLAGSKWEMQREFTGNVVPAGVPNAATSGVIFRIDDNGQVYYTAATIASYDSTTAKLSFAAQTLNQS